jgi:hypothetical protein
MGKKPSHRSPFGRGMRPPQGAVYLVQDSPLDLALACYDDVRLEHNLGVEPTTTETEGTAMNEHTTVLPDRPLDDHPTIGAMRKEISRLNDSLVAAHQAYNRLSLRMDDMGTEIRHLREQVQELQDAKPIIVQAGHPLDPHLLRVLRFAPGFRMNPTTVWENLPREVKAEFTNARTADRLEVLARKGEIIRHKEEGRNALYSVEPGDDD